MALGLGTAAPLPVGTISHMAAARLATARPAKMIRLYSVQRLITIYHIAPLVDTQIS